MNLLIAFGKAELFNIPSIKKLKIEKNILYLVCPFDFVHFFFSLKNKNLLRSNVSLKNKTINYLKKEIPNLKIKSLKPDIFKIIYFFPISLFKTILNTAKLIKILKGDRAYLYSNNIDITGYCLDSLQRFIGNKFRIEEQNNFIRVAVTFVFLLSLEIYLNWFISTFQKKKIKKVIINHNVYAESGLIGDFCKSIFKSDIFLNQRKFRDNIKLNDVKNIYLNYIPNSKKKILNKKFFWYENNAIRQNKNLKNKKIDTNRVLVIMHSFADAAHIHYKYGKLFQSYYQWTKETLEIAKSLKNQQFIFRAHPSSYTLYGKDKRIFSKLFKNLPKNIKFENPNLTSNPLHNFKKKIPIIITYKGSIILEMGCSGINVVSIESRGSGFSSIRPSSLSEYKKILGGKINTKSFYLKEKQILDYKKNEINFKDFLIY